MLLAEFDYAMQQAPSIPFIDTAHEQTDMLLLKRYGLPLLYWHFILTGVVDGRMLSRTGVALGHSTPERSIPEARFLPVVASQRLQVVPRPPCRGGPQVASGG